MGLISNTKSGASALVFFHRAEPMPGDEQFQVSAAAYSGRPEYLRSLSLAKQHGYHLYRTPVTTSSAVLCKCAWLALYPPVVFR